MYNVAHGNDFVRIANEAVGQPADVHQAAVVHADIDEAAEIDDIEHRAGQLHAGREIFQLDNALLEDRRRQILARIAARPHELGENVAKRLCSDRRLASRRLGFGGS